MDSLDQLRVTTPSGSVPVSNFVERLAKNKLDSIERVDGEYIMTIRANVKSGTVADNKVVEQEAFIQSSSFDPRINIVFRGATEEQNESLEFIGFAVVMSTTGVLLGLLTFDQTFSVLLTGIGIVALATNVSIDIINRDIVYGG
jgi:multidrug efflux pump